MLSLNKNLFLLIFLIYNVRCQQNLKKLPITILYESLCPDSISFIQDQLYPTWKELGQYLDINFVPFGKSSSFNSKLGKSFACQHGPNECVGNKVQSCALQFLPSNSQVHFVKCFMNLQHSPQECAYMVNLDWKNVEQCFQTNTGTILQLEAESLTKTYQPNFIPTIIFGEEFNRKVQQDSLKNFRSVVCAFLSENHIYANCT